MRLTGKRKADGEDDEEEQCLGRSKIKLEESGDGRLCADDYASYVH